MSSGDAFDDMQEIIQDFIVESGECLEGLEQQFVELETEPDNKDLLNDIFRSMHTIKGSAGFLGFTKIVDVAHSGENILNKLRQGGIVISQSIIDVILEAADILKKLLTNIKNGSEGDLDITFIVEKLKNVLSDAEDEFSQNSGDAIQAKEELQAETVTAEVITEVSASFETQSPDVNIETKAVPEEIIAVEEAVSKPDVSKIIDETKEKTGIKTDGSAPTIRVEAERLDHVMNLVGEVVLSRNRAMKLSSELEEKYDDDEKVRNLYETIAQLSRVTTDLQLAVMKTRMVPLGKVLNKFPRMVRDLAKKLGKKVNLEIFGEETELDKSVVDMLGDPLVHIIRNSIDHGIESPEDRVNKGKSAEGTIKLMAFQEGNHIVIRVEDDGKGLDINLIKRKAIEKLLYTEKDFENMTDEAVMDIIFMPGFSTKSVTTDVSGRGVGMDVVKTALKKINGFVYLTGGKQSGTVVSIKLPLTIAIIQALMVKVEHEVFAIPLVSVMETVKITPKNIKTIDGRMVLNLREHVLPLVNLREEFGVEKNGDTKETSLYVVVVSVGERSLGLLVNKLLRQEEVVIKSLGNYLSGIKGVSGATITGEGKVVLILDMAEVVSMIQSGRSMQLESLDSATSF